MNSPAAAVWKMRSPVVSLLLSVSLCLLVPAGAGSEDGPVERGGPVSLNAMFREVEMLMEDTQQMLEEAVDQVRALLN